jgi:mRNA interferase RelE/StbE
MYSLEISATSETFLKKLQRKDAERIFEKLQSIRDEPLRYVVRLKGSRLWKLRIGDYRAEADILIEGQTIFVVRIGHRRSIYEQGF